MLESYEQEIIRKRRASRVFWFLVFAFATFLYFFFKGYYPAFDITWKQVFSSGGVKDITRDELIRSFGIINIRAYPKDVNITLNNEDFGFDEKKMVPYGRYRISIGKPGYIQDRVRFEINRETPFFISEVQLIPRATYTKIGTGELSMIKIDNENWIAIEEKTRLLYDKYFLTGSRIPRGGEPIGDGYFLSGTSLYRYGNADWEKKSWSGSIALIKKCNTQVQVQFGYLVCPNSGEVLGSDGFLYKGIDRVEAGYLLGSGTLIANKKKYLLNESERTNTLFIEYNKMWYTPNGGLLIPIVSNTDKKSIPLIDTHLDAVTYLTTFEGNIVVFGKKGLDTFVVFLKNNNPILIPFPDIPMNAVRISKNNGNIYFKTANALIFLYEGSEKVEWLTEGEILAYSEVAALYRKDGEVWRVFWGEKE